MKKKINYQQKGILCIFSVLLLAAFIAACSNPTGSINTDALTAKIAEAETAKLGVQTANSADDVPLGLQWASAAALTAFNNAINTAKSVRDSPSSQSAVNSAVTDLDTAIAAFNAAIDLGEGPAVNITALISTISEAKALVNSVEVSADGTDVAAASYWVPSAAMNILTNAVTVADSVQNNITSQSAVDTAVSALDSAIEYFNNAKQQGTQLNGFSAAQLSSLITRAEATEAGVSVSADGNDIGPFDSWVTQAALTSLDSAITMAGLADDGTRDYYYQTLLTALNNFNNAITNGNTPSDSDKEALVNAIRAANTAKAGVIEAANKTTALLGSRWANATQWALFNTAYNNATAANSINATVNQVSSATTALINATTNFTAAVDANGPGEYAPYASITITGLNSSSFPTDTQVQLGLYKSLENIVVGIEPEVYGEGWVSNGRVEIPLYSNYQRWLGDGTWYFGFMIENEKDPIGFEIYTHSASHNFSSNPNPTFAFSSFSKMAVFSITLDQLTEGQFLTYFPSGSANLGTFLYAVSNGEVYDDATWLAFVASLSSNMGIEVKVCWDEKLQQPINSVNRTVYANTKIYSNYPFWMGDDNNGGGGNQGEQVGTITGSVVLTNIPASSTIYMSVRGNSNQQWWETSNNYRVINSGNSEASRLVSFEIPVYDGNNFQSGLDCQLQIRVQLSNGLEYQAYVPIPSITNSNQYLGTLNDPANLSYTTLSGSANISNSGTSSWLRFSVYSQDVYYQNSIGASNGSGNIGWYRASSAGNNISWTMAIGYTNASTVRFDINAYPTQNADYYDKLFSNDISIDVDISGGNYSGIYLSN